MASSTKVEGSNLTKEGDEKKAEDASNKGRSTTERVRDIPGLLFGEVVEYFVCCLSRVSYIAYTIILKFSTVVFIAYSV